MKAVEELNPSILCQWYILLVEERTDCCIIFLSRTSNPVFFPSSIVSIILMLSSWD